MSHEGSDERTVAANGVALCVQTFGAPEDPGILLIGNSMLSWPDDLCAQLAYGGRFVVRYDLRDTGWSTTVDPDAPAYTLRDLVADAAELIGALGMSAAHVIGFGVGGWIAQLLGLDHPARVASLTLIGTRPNAPGPTDADLPEHGQVLMRHLMAAPEPVWSDRDSVIAAMVESARQFAGSAGIDETAVRARAGAVFDRADAARPLGVDLRAFQRANHMSSTFAALDSAPRWRERLGTITARTLVVHGEDDPFFPVGNGEALAREIPQAELLRLPGTGQELPERVLEVLVPAILRHTAGDSARRRGAAEPLQ